MIVPAACPECGKFNNSEPSEKGKLVEGDNFNLIVWNLEYTCTKCGVEYKQVESVRDYSKTYLCVNTKDTTFNQGSRLIP